MNPVMHFYHGACHACDEVADSYAWVSLQVFPYDPKWMVLDWEVYGFAVAMIYCHKCLAKVNRK